MTTIRTVAVIGAGQMGSGIAQAVASGGYEVRLYDLSAERTPLAQGEIAASLARRAGRGLMTPAEADAALSSLNLPVMGRSTPEHDGLFSRSDCFQKDEPRHDPERP